MEPIRQTSRRPAVFLDRDGVLNLDHGYVHRPDQIHWTPGAISAVRRLNDLGYRVVVVTNQAGVAHGHYEEEAVHALHAWMRDELAKHGASIDAFYHCPYHPEAKVERFRSSHIDRKPGPGMILRAFTDLKIDKDRSFLIGDKQTDIAAAQAAGIPGFLFSAGNLADFIEECLKRRPSAHKTFAGGRGHPVVRAFPQLGEALPPLLVWIKNEALPFWGTTGVDAAHGGFHERLDLAGAPIIDVPKRLMVQGRQLYVFCHAGLLGWSPDARRLADRCVEYMLGHFYRRDNEAGFVHSLTPDGGIANATRDTYAHAFALLGLAWYHRFTGDAQVLEIVEETLAFLDLFLASDRGGYFDAVPRLDALRRQNPHMHLFEAFIALHQATGDARFLARAGEIFGVFSTGFFQPSVGAVCEYLTEDLEPVPDARGRISEPGHHYEWIWLLRNFQRASGRDVSVYCSALYDHANRYGWDAAGYIRDEVELTGAVLKTSRRSWPHTEALKANIVEGELGRANCDAHAARCLQRLGNTFVGRPFAAGWIDHVDERGAPLGAMVPASTLYHLFGAIVEAARVT
jgi:mannose-6-phosphate isomerase